MRLYCYTYHAEKILQEGYLSVAANPNPKQLEMYARKAGSTDFEDIKKYLEKTLPGRTRSISCLTEKAPIEDYEHPYLDYLVHNAAVISFELDDLLKDGLVEMIYCKDNSQTAKADIDFENVFEIKNPAEIDTSPLNWHQCSEAYGSPYNMLRHYILILSKGFIPPEYLRLSATISLLSLSVVPLIV